MMDREVTPQDAELQEKILQWLIVFEQSEARLVLDKVSCRQSKSIGAAARFNRTRWSIPDCTQAGG